MVGVSPAFAADIDSLESPALASVNEAPTVVDGATVPVDPRPGFRILPYLQKPTSDQMTINWFTEQGNDATLIVRGPGLPAEGQSFTVAGIQNPVAGYQGYELSNAGWTHSGTGLTTPQGSWIRADQPFKYTQTVTGLEPGAQYTYEVVVDGYKHEAAFNTFAQMGSELTEPMHVIAFSDTETDPKGRTTFREWEVTTNLADGSEPRPGEDSAWADKFGGGVRNGTYALNYMLTEDMAQEYNNQIINDQDPDLVLLAGDLVEQGSSQTHWDEFFTYFSGDRGNILDDTPLFTSLGNHEVYGYGTPDDRTSVVRSRMEYNHYIDTFGSDNPHALDAYHRIDNGPVTFISVDVTNGEPDTESVDSVPESQKSEGDDSTLTPEQYGTDTQSTFTKEEYDRDFPNAIENGWIEEGAEPDQPNFMPGSEQYEWLETQLQDARDKGQIIVVQWHHAAYSNGVHGTPMGNNNPDSQSGVPTRHLDPLMEEYGVATVISGHDEMFEASFVDNDGDGVGVYHWDVGVASDGLRADKKVKNENGEYVPYNFNTHSIWSAQADEPEMWVTNENGVTHLVDGGKHYGHLDMLFEAYSGDPLASGVVPAMQLTMTPVSVVPTLDDNYDVVSVERVELESGIQTVYFDADGNVLDPNAEPVEPTTPGEPAPTETDPAATQPAATQPAGTETPSASDPAKTDTEAGDKPGEDGLAQTGADPALITMLALGAAALAGGGTLLAVRRRRQS